MILIREWPQVLSQACNGEEMKKKPNRWTVMTILRGGPLGKFFNSPSKIELFYQKMRLSQKINSDFHIKIGTL